MQYKPWSLIFIGILHLIEPITKLIFYGIFYRRNPLDIAVLEFQQGGYLHSFEFFLLFPIAGVAILSVKRWSFPVFMACEIWVLVANWSYFSGLYGAGQFVMLGFFSLFAVLNLLVVAFFLLPAVRIAYLDPKVRWWECKPRYSKEIDCKLGDGKEGKILNLSETGVFVCETSELNPGDEIEVSFSFEGHEVKSKGNVIHNFSINGRNGSGVQFEDMSSASRNHLKKIVKSLENSDAPRNPPRRDSIKSFFEWFFTAIKTGKGIMPEDKRKTPAR